MKMHILYYLLVLFFSLFFIPSCDYPVDPSDPGTGCQKDYTTHPKHTQYQAVMDKYAKEGITGLSAVMITPKEGYWSGAAGFANLEDSVPMNRCHLHHTASLAKSFTGIVTLQLIEEGKLSFDSNIAQYLSADVQESVPNIEKITIKHLLQHTSGIPEVLDEAFIGHIFVNRDQAFTTEELLARNKGKAGLFEPGTQHTYSDPNSMLLTLIIDKIEGDHAKAFEERIFIPLGLRNTYYHNKAYPNLVGLTQSYWDLENNGEFENISAFQTNTTSYLKGGDGIIASSHNMAVFYKAVFTGKLVNQKMLNYITTDWVKEEGTFKMNTHYSHGFMVIEAKDGRWIGHAGNQLGASGYVYYNIDTHKTIALFTNTGTLISAPKTEQIFYHLWNDLVQVVQ